MPTSVTGPEFARLSALYRYGVLDTPTEPAFDILVADLALALDAPMAQLIFADARRLVVKASVGMPVAEFARVGSLPNFLIDDQPVLAVADLLDEGNERLGSIDGIADLRSFFGVRLQTPGDDAIGALFVADRRPRAFGHDDQARLEAARDQAMLLLESNRRARVDASSGALRRSPFLEQIASVMDASRAGGQPVSLLTIDLADLRRTLDRASGGLGRLALERVGDLGREQVRQRDSLGRLDKNLFAVLLSDTDHDGARVLEQRLTTFLLQGWDALAPLLDVGALATGVATWWPGDSESPSTFVNAALHSGLTAMPLPRGTMVA